MSYANVENVVYAPQKPVPMIVRGVDGNAWYSTSPVTTPRMNEPVTLMNNVPSGSALPVRRITTPSTR